MEPAETYDAYGLASALAATLFYLDNPYDPQALSRLLACEVGGISAIRTEPGGAAPSVVTFNLEDRGHTRPLKIRCNASAFAALILTIVFGQSAFINYASGRPYLKVCGKMVTSAGIVFARILAGLEEGEICAYKDRDTRNISYPNLTCIRGSAKRGTVEWYSEVLSSAAEMPDVIYQGTAAEKVEFAGGVLHRVTERMHEEREKALEA